MFFTSTINESHSREVLNLLVKYAQTVLKWKWNSESHYTHLQYFQSILYALVLTEIVVFFKQIFYHILS